MKKILSLTILIIVLSSIKNICYSQKDIYAKNFNVNSFIKIDSIKSIQIYNTWTGKKWLITEKNLIHVKAILKKSYVSKYLLLKPGHLYIKFIGHFDYTDYDTYMYNGTIYFDPYLDKNTLKPVKNLKPFLIELKKPIDWAKLN